MEKGRARPDGVEARFESHLVKRHKVDGLAEVVRSEGSEFWGGVERFHIVAQLEKIPGGAAGAAAGVEDGGWSWGEERQERCINGGHIDRSGGVEERLGFDVVVVSCLHVRGKSLLH